MSVKFIYGLFFLLVGCSTQQAVVNVQDHRIDFDGASLKEGIPAYGKTEYVYQKDGKNRFKIDLGEPIVVAVADKPYKWGFFQFPGLYWSDQGEIVARWNMAHDDAESYGKGGHGYAVSKDNGKTWTQADKPPIGGGLALKNGEYINIHTPPAMPRKDLHLPEPIATVKEAYGRTFRFWKMEDLPKELQGVYIQRRTKERSEWIVEHNDINEPNMVRYSDNDLLPIVWWGDMKLEKDGSIVAGVYPGFTFVNGTVPSSDVAFYRSQDGGRSWSFIGRIPYHYDPIKDPKGGQRHALGWTEPAFEILQDGSYLSVIRTTDGLGSSPMYYSRSTDQGKSWNKPTAFTKAGVLPKLKQLDNGALVLASGRPGLQIRIALDEEGEEWSDPFEMLPWLEGVDGNTLTCGYPELLQTGKDKFLLIYSDFQYKTSTGDIRKAIKTREITVKKM
ncbi:sialidase family protein [Sphingobacterium corticibacterium]|uniref:Exo-alpha-sialidase n=1 Tax=Sphingobacterium corticibacterium TaxID=2484746 RepID=A0A4Q6XPR5_9SPHI|nr:sialidase family protein [Sphingobacterium corticibacterium]RZF59354.1 exo-alpha-sialidase [Sphingobacterium corticibacterium]